MSLETLTPSNIEARMGEPIGFPRGVFFDATSPVQVLHPNQFLFETGDVKTCLYRVVSGAVAIYEQRWNSQRPTIEFAFPGDLVGLGFLERHACCARAIAESRLTLLPLDAQSSAIENDPRAKAKLDQAVEREFEFRRASLISTHQQSPLKRVAAFLVSASRINANEGLDPTLISDPCPCGFVADLLGLSVGSLAALLVELERRGLVGPCHAAGLRLKDIAALENLAA